LLIVYNYRHVQPSLLQLYCGPTVNYGGRALKSRNWTSRDLTTWHQIAGVDIARPNSPVPDQAEVLEQSSRRQIITAVSNV